MESRGVVGHVLVMLTGLKLRRPHVAQSTMQTPVIPRVDVLSGCELHLLERAPGSSACGSPRPCRNR